MYQYVLPKFYIQKFLVITFVIITFCFDNNINLKNYINYHVIYGKMFLNFSMLHWN